MCSFTHVLSDPPVLLQEQMGWVQAASSLFGSLLTSVLMLKYFSVFYPKFAVWNLRTRIIHIFCFALFECIFSSVQSLSRVRLCDPMDCSTPGLPVHHQLLEFTQTHVHWVSDAIQPSHPLSSPSPPPFNLSQYQGLFKWVSYSHYVAKVLEFQLQHQSFQWIFRTDFL